MGAADTKRSKVTLWGSISSCPNSYTLPILWSTLLKRVFEVDGFECPLCDQPMRLQAVVLPPATLRVLDGLEQACRGPPQQGAA